MKLNIFFLGLFQVIAFLTISAINAEKKLADPTFVKHQKQVLDLLVGLGHEEDHHEHGEETPSFLINANEEHFHKPELIKEFIKSYEHGFLPKDELFTLFCPHVRKQTRRLFDLFYLAKDFATFYKVAQWARMHINQMQFGYAYTLALMHREDCKDFSIPPLYEIFPTYFVPADTMHQVYEAKMKGIKENKFTYNNTGYEYYYHVNLFGGPLNSDATGHLDYKISYFREDVGLNNMYVHLMDKIPSWMCPFRYNGIDMHKRGELFYTLHQQIFARYTLERLANGLPFVERLNWNSPINVGYNPRVTYYNGLPFHTRPDNAIPQYNQLEKVKVAKMLEHRFTNIIDIKAVWNPKNVTLVEFDQDHAIEIISKIIYGTTDRPMKKFFPSYFWQAMDILGQLISTSNDRNFQGEALSTKLTTLRDPVFYQFLNRFLSFYERYHPHPYKKEELNFPGVSIKDFEIDELITYFDMFEYEITNGVPMNDPHEYTDYKYYARQYRLNHKPYTFKFKLNSEKPTDAVVRMFIGPKYDAEGHLLHLEQSRMAFVQLDLFHVKLNAGENLIERSSTDTHFYSPDPEGFRSLYVRLTNSLNKSEPFYINENNNCGVPSRYQLPKGWKNGHKFVLAIIVTHATTNLEAKPERDHCKFVAEYDRKSLGFPFDRPIFEENTCDLHNILFKDVLIYHKEERDINRPTK